MIYKSIKCSHISCPNEAIGYFAGGGWGLWLCNYHGGTQGVKILVQDIKDNPTHKNRWQLVEEFNDGIYIKPKRHPPVFKGKTQKVYGVVVYDDYKKEYKLFGTYGTIFKDKKYAEDWAKTQSKYPYPDFEKYEIKEFIIDDPSPEYGGVLGSWHLDENGYIYFKRSCWQGD
jgi:hypothetical protein